MGNRAVSSNSRTQTSAHVVSAIYPGTPLKRSISAGKLVLLMIAAMPVGQAVAASDCTVLTTPDAAALLSTPLPENFKSDSPPAPEIGHDSTSACGWFPTGYSLATASAPPDHGILIVVHAFRTPADTLKPSTTVRDRD